jgi:sterol desaturase/sphingolipid hydroxylase (fatty acid hydroxylase superfamily)
MDAFVSWAAGAYAYSYFGVLLALAVVEWALPRRRAGKTLGTRWLGNVGVGVLDVALIRVLFPVANVAWAATCATRGWGALNQVTIPDWAGVVASLAVLDFTAYAQHWLLHRIPLLWRLHLVHHTDQEVDFTTGLRFHPLEAVYTTLMRFGAITLIGLPPLGVLVAELASVIVSFWEHANVRVPRRFDQVARFFIVTPDVHRTHHSQDGRDNRSNFGNVSTCWDRLFGTYRDRPVTGDSLVPGVRGFEDRKHSTIPWLLAQPFVTVDEQEADPHEASVRSVRL